MTLAFADDLTMTIAYDEQKTYENDIKIIFCHFQPRIYKVMNYHYFVNTWLNAKNLKINLNKTNIIHLDNEHIKLKT